MQNVYFLLSAISFFSSYVDAPKFEAQVLDSNIAIGYGLAIGDVDGDKKPDILLADKKQFVWYRNGDWKRFILVSDLTASDNVCIAARDIDGDGKVEIAVGAQWNPGETSDTVKSGSVHYLIRPTDPTQPWKAVELHHEPTIHRMRWVKVSKDKFQLVVLPLHGRGNKDGNGKGVKVIAYERPTDVNKRWKMYTIDTTMHMTHNMDLVGDGDGEQLRIGGKEGIRAFRFDGSRWTAPSGKEWQVKGNGFGELRFDTSNTAGGMLAGIEPMHGNNLTVYTPGKHDRITLTAGLNQGHALAVADVVGSGLPQVVAGWREPDQQNKVGVKIFVAQDPTFTKWVDYWIDDNGMACEDLQLADLDGDGKKDIIASGRASHNLKIYWNKNPK
ncbi:MAG TPA: VCBS repeat-containing protein [Chryseolinea sp.]|nr:VCBS repeat-containing protein [Chryseolinea sp.]